MSSRNCKLIVLGNSAVGKTTIIHSFINKEFRADFKSTLGADFSSKSFVIDGQTVELQIWDTAGEERFHSVGAAFYRGTDACILVYDITQRSSFEKLEFWRQDLIEKSSIDVPDQFPFVIFGNKADLEDMRQVSKQEAETWAANHNCTLFEVSAKSMQNVEEGFKKVTELFIQSNKSIVNPIDVVPFRIVPQNPPQESDKCGC